MHRRAYLAITAAVLAGCTGSDDPSTDEPTTESPTPTATETPTATPADEPTATPSDELVTADHLDAADGHLHDAVAAFLAPADGEDLTAVDGRVEPDVAGVTDALDAMADELDAAAEHATEDQQATVADLRHLRSFLADVGDVQSGAHRLWTAARDGVPATIGESFDDLENHLGRMGDRRDAVGRGLDSLAEDADAGATAVTDAITEDGYAAKRDQLAAERATAGAVREALQSTREGMPDFAEAADDYANGSLGNAEVKFWSAHGAFQDARDALPAEPAAAYAQVVADLDSFLSTVEEVSDLLERSARLGGEKVSEDEAETVLAESDLAADSPSASDLLAWLRNRD